LLKNLQNTTGDYFFLPHPVYSDHLRPKYITPVSPQQVRNKLATSQ